MSIFEKLYFLFILMLLSAGNLAEHLCNFNNFTYSCGIDHCNPFKQYCERTEGVNPYCAICTQDICNGDPAEYPDCKLACNPTCQRAVTQPITSPRVATELISTSTGLMSTSPTRLTNLPTGYTPNGNEHTDNKEEVTNTTKLCRDTNDRTFNIFTSIPFIISLCFNVVLFVLFVFGCVLVIWRSKSGMRKELLDGKDNLEKGKTMEMPIQATDLNCNVTSTSNCENSDKGHNDSTATMQDSTTIVQNSKDILKSNTGKYNGREHNTTLKQPLTGSSHPDVPRVITNVSADDKSQVCVSGATHDKDIAKFQ